MDSSLIAPMASLCKPQSMSDPDRRAYQSWHARLGVETMGKMRLVMVPLRFAQLAWLARASANLLMVMLVCSLILAGHGVLHVVARRRRVASVADAQQDLWFWVGVQLTAWFTVVTVAACFMATSVDNLVKDKLMLGGALPAFVIQSSVMYLPRWVYLAVVLPVNFGACLLFCYSAACASIAPTALQCIVVLVICAYIYILRDQNQGRLYSANLTTERARRATELERQNVDAWRGAFQGMLEGVFDASCTCNAGGAVHAATPQLDSLLLGGGGVTDGSGLRLQGLELPSFATDADERMRLKSFLADLVGCSGMRKLQVSLSQTCAAGSSQFIEVTVCGIALSSVAVSELGCESSGSDAQLFLGFQFLGGWEPTEMPESIATAEPSTPAYLQAPWHGAGTRSQPRSVGDVDSDLASSVGEPPRLGRAPSRFSAPPVIVEPESSRRRMAATKTCSGEDGDCLPPDAVVWIEGQSMPAKVGDVGSGQRVLCYDHLGGGLKYSEVVEIATHDASASEWVVVKLEDGTELKMTSDHPIYPRTAGLVGECTGAAVKAGELQASVHSVEVLRLVPVLVQEVQFLSDADCGGAPIEASHMFAPSERVSLSVHQAERHSVFVSSGPSGREAWLWHLRASTSIRLCASATP